MKVEPELLELLSEEQKQLLFAKIREEQKRRWRVKEKELEKKELVSPPKRTPAKVCVFLLVICYFYFVLQINFLMGSDQQPWVWVMGEHQDDTSYEELVAQREREEQERERLGEIQDRKEAEELAKLETTIASGASGLSRTESAPVMMDQSPVKESPALERRVDLNKKSKYGLLWKKAITERVTLIGYYVHTNLYTLVFNFVTNPTAPQKRKGRISKEKGHKSCLKLYKKHAKLPNREHNKYPKTLR